MSDVDGDGGNEMVFVSICERDDENVIVGISETEAVADPTVLENDFVSEMKFEIEEDFDNVRVTHKMRTNFPTLPASAVVPSSRIMIFSVGRNHRLQRRSTRMRGKKRRDGEAIGVTKDKILLSSVNSRKLLMRIIVPGKLVVVADEDENPVKFTSGNETKESFA